MKKTKKLLLRIMIIVMIFILMFSVNNPKIYADVGDYGSDWSDYDYDYDYDYGSSWDSDYDYDYGSSWDSDYDYDYDYSYSGSSDFELDLILALLFSGNGEAAFILIIFILISAATRKSRKRKYRSDWYMRQNMARERERRYRYQYKSKTSYVRSTYPNSNFTTTNNAQSVEQEILKTDELFNREEFESWVKQVFIKLQYAWTDRDWTGIRTFETNELFEQHNTQLNRYIEKKQINVLERVAVYWVKLHNFYKTAEKEVLEVTLNAKMIDYIIDETTGKVISGDKTTERVRTYKLTFIRKIGIKTKPGKITAQAMNCPNCGGQLKITQAGKCEYCGSIVVVDDHGWALSELEPFNT